MGRVTVSVRGGRRTLNKQDLWAIVAIPCNFFFFSKKQRGNRGLKGNPRTAAVLRASQRASIWNLTSLHC